MYNIIRNFFNKIDPVGIICDDNIDEYKPEIDKLLSLDIDYKDSDILYGSIKSIFSEYFEGIEIEDALIRELSKRINNYYKDIHEF